MSSESHHQKIAKEFIRQGYEEDVATDMAAAVVSGEVPMCPDCGAYRETRGHMECAYPHD